MFTNVKPKWKSLFFHKDVKPELIKVLEKLENDIDSLSPPLELIFAAFTYFDIDDLKVIIIGQDPYPENALGLSFASNSNPKPKSLQNIYKCLEYHGYQNPNALEWPKQGVLLLNRYLTSHKFWDKFTNIIVQKTINYHNRKNRNIPVLMWGEQAKMTLKNTNALYWGHPSPAANHNQVDCPKNFKYCNHFTKVNDLMKKWGEPTIEWGGSIASQIVVFTDGGCTGNGKAHAIASYAFYFPDRFLDKSNAITGSENGKVPKEKIRPSNNRGELLAIILALEKIKKSKIQVPITIVTDSEYALKIITERIWNWVKNNKTFSDKKNTDYLQRLYKLLLYFKELNQDIEMLHQRSHLKEEKIPKKDPNVKTGGLDYEKYANNKIVDKLCTKALNTKLN
jgi:uracil-DNA glycosylase